MIFSVRDPYQVFTLLETIYGAFDKVAHRRKVFKVETIGDSYVAGRISLVYSDFRFSLTISSFSFTIILSIVAGLPEPRCDHAVVMAKFASDILCELAMVTSQLETRLGPGTASLTARVGVRFRLSHTIVH
jgi:Adenylate and Guanylate cyclase catalytic domain